MYHTCIVGGQRLLEGWSRIGNDDLRTIVRNSIDNYKATTDDGELRVGMRGWMQCGPDAERDIVELGLY